MPVAGKAARGSSLFHAPQGTSAPQVMEAGPAVPPWIRVPPVLPGPVRGSGVPLRCCGAQLGEWAWVNTLMFHCLRSTQLFLMANWCFLCFAGSTLIRYMVQKTVHVG